METSVNSFFKSTDEKIGSGKYANVFKGLNMETGLDLAIKIKKQKYDESDHISNEAKIYEIFRGDELSKNYLPEIYFLSKDLIVMEMLGPSLEELFQKCSRKFSLKTVLMLADQMISILEYVHSKNIVHVDVSTNNFLFGLEKRSKTLCLIDFGLAFPFIDKEGKHILFSEDEHLRGTYMFASFFNNYGLEHTRRDDMVSLGYILLYFLSGTLPWEDFIDKNPDSKWLEMDVKRLKNRFWRNLRTYDYPEEFMIYMEYNQELLFEAKPDYEYLRKIFNELFIKKGYARDYIYDWNLI